MAWSLPKTYSVGKIMKTIHKNTNFPLCGIFFGTYFGTQNTFFRNLAYYVCWFFSCSSCMYKYPNNTDFILNNF